MIVTGHWGLARRLRVQLSACPASLAIADSFAGLSDGNRAAMRRCRALNERLRPLTENDFDEDSMPEFIYYRGER